MKDCNCPSFRFVFLGAFKKRFQRDALREHAGESRDREAMEGMECISLAAKIRQGRCRHKRPASRLRLVLLEKSDFEREREREGERERCSTKKLPL